LLLRYRQSVLCLNVSYELTHGNPLGVSTLFSRLDLSSGILTAVSKTENGNSPLAGQVIYNRGERSAHMTFLLPDSPAELEEEGALIDHLAQKSGEMGALNLLADVAESHMGFELLRRNGFTVYCWENVWRLPSSLPATVHYKDLWHEEKDSDELAIRSFYQTVVPSLVQTAEPFDKGPLRRLVYRQQGELMAFVDSVSGPNGFYLKPVIHPSVEDIRSLLGDLIHTLQPIGKPVYFPVRSYQAWVADSLEELGARMSPRRACMVRHLAVPVPSENAAVLLKRLDPRSVEPTTSIVQNSSLSAEKLP
jgi:hypothetical protein